VPVATEAPSTNWVDILQAHPKFKDEWGVPVSGGTLKHRNPRNPSYATPNNGISTTAGVLNSPMYNTLVRFDPWVGLSSIIPDLAKSWVPSDDGLKITMKLEENVVFQNNPNLPDTYNGGKINGDAFTCEDAQASLELAIRPPESEKRRITRGKAYLSHITSSDCPDGPLAHTLVLNLSLPLAGTLPILAAGNLEIVDKDFINWWTTEKPGFFHSTTTENFPHLHGTGPFQPVEFQPDVRFTHKANPDYWREGLPFVDGIESFIILDYATAFTALLTGQVHVFGRGSWALQAGQAAQAQRDFADRVELHDHLHAFADGLSFYFYPPLDDIRLRRAISLTLDRDAYVKFWQAGDISMRSKMMDFIPDTDWSPTAETLATTPGLRPEKEADRKLANELLDDQFGPGERPELVCNVQNVEDQTKICLFFGDQMKKHLGITVKMEFEERTVRTPKTDTCQMTITGGSGGGNSVVGQPDDWIFGTFYRDNLVTPGSICRSALWAEAEPELTVELEELAWKIRTELDQVKRKEMVLQWETKHFTEMITKIGFAWNRNVNAILKGVVRGYSCKNQTLCVYTKQGIDQFERLWLVK